MFVCMNLIKSLRWSVQIKSILFYFWRKKKSYIKSYTLVIYTNIPIKLYQSGTCFEWMGFFPIFFYLCFPLSLALALVACVWAHASFSPFLLKQVSMERSFLFFVVFWMKRVRKKELNKLGPLQNMANGSMCCVYCKSHKFVSFQ